MSKTNDTLRYALIALAVFLFGSIGMGVSASDDMFVTEGFCEVQDWASGEQFADRFVDYYVHEGLDAPVVTDIAIASAETANAIKCITK